MVHTHTSTGETFRHIKLSKFLKVRIICVSECCGDMEARGNKQSVSAVLHTFALFWFCFGFGFVVVLR